MTIYYGLDDETIQSKEYIGCYQCFGSGSGWIRIIWPGPDPDPLQETLIFWNLLDLDPGPDPDPLSRKRSETLVVTVYRYYIYNM